MVSYNDDGGFGGSPNREYDGNRSYGRNRDYRRDRRFGGGRRFDDNRPKPEKMIRK